MAVRVPFSNLLFPKSADKNVPFSCEREAYPSHFHRFQNVSASCKRSLNKILHNTKNKEMKKTTKKMHEWYESSY